MPTALGDLLRERRESLGLGLRELARRIGRSPTYVVHLERSDELPGATEETLEAIAGELQLDRDEVMTLAGRIPAEVSPRSATELALYRLISRMHPQRQEELRTQLEEELQKQGMEEANDD